jgi:hypothetical protein
LALIFAINPFLLFFPFITSFPYIFLNILCRNNAHSFLPDNYPKNLFSRSFLCYNFSFSQWAMPIIEGIKPPCKPYHVVPLVLWGERET